MEDIDWESKVGGTSDTGAESQFELKEDCEPRLRIHQHLDVGGTNAKKSFVMYPSENKRGLKPFPTLVPYVPLRFGRPRIDPKSKEALEAEAEIKDLVKPWIRFNKILDRFVYQQDAKGHKNMDFRGLETFLQKSNRTFEQKEREVLLLKNAVANHPRLKPRKVHKQIQTDEIEKSVATQTEPYKPEPMAMDKRPLTWVQRMKTDRFSNVASRSPVFAQYIGTPAAAKRKMFFLAKSASAKIPPWR